MASIVTKPLASSNTKEMIELLKSARLSDFTIIAKNDKIHVHRALLLCKSPFFAKLVTRDFKDSQEAVLLIHDHEPLDVGLFLIWIYTDTLDPDLLTHAFPLLCESTLDTSSQLIKAFQTMHRFISVYRLASRFLIPRLQTVVTETMSHFWSLNYHHFVAPTTAPWLARLFKDLYESTGHTDIYLRPQMSGDAVKLVTSLTSRGGENILAHEHLHMPLVEMVFKHEPMALNVGIGCLLFRDDVDKKKGLEELMDKLAVKSEGKKEGKKAE